MLSNLVELSRLENNTKNRKNVILPEYYISFDHTYYYEKLEKGEWITSIYQKHWTDISVSTMCVYHDYCVYHYTYTELISLYTLDMGL